MLAFGRQVDAQAGSGQPPHRRPRPGGLSPGQVAGYLAKYATKSTTDSTGTTGSGNPHHQRIRATTRRLASRARAAALADRDAEQPYERLGKWVHMLGFRGHFATKSRCYSITLGALRRARRRAQALIAESNTTGRPLDLASLEADLLADEEDETTLVIGHWTYAGTGWATETQRLLATAAAARAREHDQWRAAQRGSSQESGDRTR